MKTYTTLIAIGIVALLVLAAAPLPIQRNFFTVNPAPVVQTTAGTNAFVTFTQAGQTRTYLVDVPTPSSLPFSVITNAPWAQTNVDWRSVTNLQSAQLPASVITNTIPDGSLSTNVPLRNVFNFWLNNNEFTTAVQIDGTFTVTNLAGFGGKVKIGSTGSVASTNQLEVDTTVGAKVLEVGTNGVLYANGNGLTNLNASALASGTVPLAQIPVTVVTNATTSGVAFTGYSTQTNASATYGTAQTNSGNIQTATLNSTGNTTVGGTLFPSGDGSKDLGSSSVRWNVGYIKSVNSGASSFTVTGTGGSGTSIALNPGGIATASFQNGSLNINSTLTATNCLFGAYGCATMSTGTVVVATSTSTNTFTAWSYLKTFGGIGSLTNTSIVVTNAGDYRISFGCSLLGGNGDAVKALILTNDVVCPLIMFEKTMANPAISETGFKEVVVNLPAACRVGIGIANGSANNTSVQNLCFNVKGAN